MLEIKGEAVLDKKFSEALPKEYVEQLEPLLGEIKSSGLDSIERQLTVNWEGKSLSLLINLTTLRDEEGKPLGVLTVFDDLTQLMKAQRMAAWREVPPPIHPEIKKTLTPIHISAHPR